jgi:hypothetical protein
MRALLAYLILLAGAGCAPLQSERIWAPSREGSTSELVRFAYFTKALLKSGPLVFTEALPLNTREFDLDRDRQVVFFVVIDAHGKDLTPRGVLRRPDGSVSETFSPLMEARWARELDNRFFLTRFAYHGSFHFREVPIERLRGHPGEWRVDLFLDDTQVGSYRFFLGSADMIAQRAREAPARKPGIPEPTAPAPAPRPPAVAEPRVPDGEAPKIVLNYPPAHAMIDREQIVVLGLVTDNAEVDRVRVAVNGIEAPQPRDIAVTGKGWSIRAPVSLLPGENTIEVTASDKAGNVAQVARTVTRIVRGAAVPRIVNRWAVVIGIGEYAHPRIPKLRYAVQDAEAVHKFLTTDGGYPSDHVLLLTDRAPTKPTLGNLRRALGEFLARKAGKDDMVLIYYAGHGAPEVDVAGNETDGLSKYLVPLDADPDSLYATAFPMDEIQRVFGRIAAERVVFFLDTCYSGSAGGRTFAGQRVRATGLNDQFLERLTRSKGRVIISASGPNEVSLELPELGHGVFTYYLLEGLRGKGDRNGDGVVTVSELYEYMGEEVQRKAREAGGRQHPIMKGEIEGALPLAWRRP